VFLLKFVRMIAFQTLAVVLTIWNEAGEQAGRSVAFDVQRGDASSLNPPDISCLVDVLESTYTNLCNFATVQ
jgi:hypothetical protein